MVRLSSLFRRLNLPIIVMLLINAFTIPGATARESGTRTDLSVTMPASSQPAIVPMDTQAPSVPTNLTSTNYTSTTVALAWAAVVDASDISYHVIADDGASGPTLVGETTATSYVVGDLVPERAYRFTVAAYDGAGNASPESTPISITTLPGPKLPVLDTQVTISPDPVQVGTPVTLTLTVTNQADVPAEELAVRLPVPMGARALTDLAGAPLPPDAGLAHWVRSLGQLPARQSVSLTASFILDRMPEGRALLFHPQAFAQGLATPSSRRMGALVGGRRADSTTAGIAFTPGQAISVAGSDGSIRLAIPPDLYNQPLTLSIATNVDDTVAQDIGFKRGLGAFELHALDAQGNDVHQFNAPLTISVNYTPMQLEALNLAEGYLTLFWFDHAVDRWIPLPTEVDRAAHTVSAKVDHFSHFQLTSGFDPSTTFVPSVEGWQTAAFMGAASYAMPIDVPSAGGGLKPQLQLTYDSAQKDGDSKLAANQSSWVGKGWDLSVPYIARVKKAHGNQDYFSLALNGKSYTIVRGAKLAGSPYSDNWLQGWFWHSTNEEFVKIRAVYRGDYAGQASGTKRHVWVVWTKDGTKYEFNNDVTWQLKDDQGGCVVYEAYKWMLSQVTDPHGNSITYNYTSLPEGNTGCTGNVQPSIWPTEITWGKNFNVSGSIDRFRVTFDSSPRSTNNRIDRNVDMEWDYPKHIDQYKAPHETQKLNKIVVWSKQASTWEPVREYRFTTDYSLLSDASLCANGSCSADTTYKKLTLKEIQLVGRDGTLFPTKTTFTYNTTRGTGVNPNGGWNRLTMVNNGQGGTVTFSYANIAQDYSGQPWSNIFFNRNRVTKREVKDGRGNTYAWNYSYGMAAVNSLGNRHGGKGPNPEPNSAPLFYWDKLNRPPDTLAVAEHREFRGHDRVTETLPTGAKVAHYFVQGEGDTDTNPENGVGCWPAAAASSDTCFARMRDQGFQVGHEWKTEWQTSGSTALKAVVKTFANIFYPSTLYEAGGANNGFPEYTKNGLWRAFRFESQSIEKLLGGNESLNKTTKFFYTTTPYQVGDVQYGNLTKVAEYGGTTLQRVTEFFYTRNDQETWNWNGAGTNQATFTMRWLVDRKWAEQIRDGVLDANGNGRMLSLSQYYYDGNNQAPTSLGDRGLVTRVSRYANVPLQSNTIGFTFLGPDVTYTFDQYGNRTQATSYTGMGSRRWDGSAWSISPPGNGSSARTTTTDYDSTFHVYPTRVTHPVPGLVESAGYDLRTGTMTSVTDYNGNVTTAEYDAFLRITKLIKPFDNASYPTALFIYKDGEKPVRYQVDLRETAGATTVRTVQHFYDGLGRAIQTKRQSTDTSGTVVDITADTRYDGLGQAVEESQPRYTPRSNVYTVPDSALFRATKTYYDSLGRVIQVVRPDGMQAVFHNYGAGNIDQWEDVVDANRHLKAFSFDAFGRLKSVWEFSGNCASDGAWGYSCGGAYTVPWKLESETLYTYDPLDQLTQVADGAGNRTTIRYDSLGRKAQMTDPDMSSWSYSYDANGNLARQTDARGQRLCFAYDALDRLIGKHYNGSSDSCPASPTTITYTYDQGTNGKGQRTAMRSPDETVNWIYDARGRKTQAAHTLAGVTRTFNWSFDSADRIKTITYPAIGSAAREVLTYNYDAGWRPTSACTSVGGCYVSSGARYTALDQPTQRTLGSGVAQTWSYNNVLARLDRLQVGSLFDRSYGYDLVGNISAITDNRTSSNSQSFGYDALDRLTSWTLGSTTQSYAYNTLGNLTNKAGTSYTYPAAGSARPHAPTSVGGQAYSYDTNGNLLSGGGRTYTWDAENRPTRIQAGASEDYGYDGDGERVKVVRGGTTTIHLEGLWEEAIGGAVKLYYPFNGQAAAMREGSTVTYLHDDHLGSVSLATSSGGALSSQQEFDPWGKVRSGGVGQTGLNYTGQRLDGTGLLYYHARYYDPGLGRFVSADSVVPGSALGSMDGVALKPLTVDFHEPGFVAQLGSENGQAFWFQLSDDERGKVGSPWGPANPQALNRYSYVQNNPLRYTDPTGHYYGSRNFTPQGAGRLASHLRTRGDAVALGGSLYGAAWRAVVKLVPVLGWAVLGWSAETRRELHAVAQKLDTAAIEAANYDNGYVRVDTTGGKVIIMVIDGNKANGDLNIISITRYDFIDILALEIWAKYNETIDNNGNGH
jgi:RHS repeat-associated protein